MAGGEPVVAVGDALLSPGGRASPGSGYRSKGRVALSQALGPSGCRQVGPGWPATGVVAVVAAPGSRRRRAAGRSGVAVRQDRFVRARSARCAPGGTDRVPPVLRRPPPRLGSRQGGCSLLRQQRRASEEEGPGEDDCSASSTDRPSGDPAWWARLGVRRSGRREESQERFGHLGLGQRAGRSGGPGKRLICSRSGGTCPGPRSPTMSASTVASSRSDSIIVSLLSPPTGVALLPRVPGHGGLAGDASPVVDEASAGDGEQPRRPGGGADATSGGTGTRGPTRRRRRGARGGNRRRAGSPHR